jgi:hypothetical protein
MFATEIEKVDVETQSLKINTILNVATLFPQEIVIKKICEVLDIDFEEIEDQLPEVTQTTPRALEEVE